MSQRLPKEAGGSATDATVLSTRCTLAAAAASRCAATSGEIIDSSVENISYGMSKFPGKTYRGEVYQPRPRG